MRQFLEFILEQTVDTNPVTVDVYHGSGRLFNKFSQSAARVENDHMGGGVGYFTSDHNLSKSYARSMAKTAKTGTPYVYHATLTMNNVFDVDHEFSGEKLKRLLPKDHEQFARAAGILKHGDDKYGVLLKLKSGDMSLTGAQVFKGLSNGHTKTAQARDHLMNHGFDGLRYNMETGVKHDVYIPYNSDSVTINKITKLVKKPSGAV